MKLSDLPTPALILDIGRLSHNVKAMGARAKKLGVALRPHVKTAKCAAVTKMATAGQAGGITVSTLKEAAYFFDNGFTDITYAVGIVPAKLAEINRLQTLGAQVRITLDSPEMAHAIGQEIDRQLDLTTDFSVMIEINSGANRGGVTAADPRLIEIGRQIDAHPRLSIAGVLSHAGHSYLCAAPADIIVVAEQERDAVVTAAENLRRHGLPCPIVSVGSTPTAIFADHLDGVTEMRPGVYTLYDISQLALGVCAEKDIALSVLASIVGKNTDQNYMLCDAGALALSQDKSPQRSSTNYGYGPVYDQAGQKQVKDIIISNVQQEHGFLTSPSGNAVCDEMPLGSRIRIMPNHACMTAAPYDKYYIVDGDDIVIDEWSKITGW